MKLDDIDALIARLATAYAEFWLARGPDGADPDQAALRDVAYHHGQLFDDAAVALRELRDEVAATYEAGVMHAIDRREIEADRDELIHDIEQYAQRDSDRIVEMDALKVENAALRAERDVLAAKLGTICAFLYPDKVKLPDGRVFTFENVAAEREMLRGLSDAIRAVLNEQI